MSLLLGILLGIAPAGAAAGSTFAVTEVPTAIGAVTDVAADPVTNIVYGASGGGPAVAVINGASNTETGQFSAPDGASTVAVDQATDTVYTVGSTTGVLVCDVINGATGNVLAKVSLPGLNVFGAAVNPQTHMVYVLDVGRGTGGVAVNGVDVIDGTTDTLAATIPIADPAVSPVATPFGVAIDTMTNTIYVANITDQEVVAISGATNAVTGRIALPTGSDPVAVAVDPSAGLVYVADQGTGAISVIQTATGSVSTLASGMAQLSGLALDAGTGTLYATAQQGGAADVGTTYVIDTASGVITAQIPRGGRSVIVPEPGGTAYVGGSGIPLDGDVTVITPSTASTMSAVIVGATSLNFTFTVGQAGQAQLTASAIPAATFSPQPTPVPPSTTGLPPGLTLSPSGLLSGTPSAGSGGTYLSVVTASNGIQPPGSAEMALTVNEAPAITSASQVTFATGVAGSFDVTATGFPVPVPTESGTLPAGVTFTPSFTGVLSGTPAPGTAGSYPIQFTASNGIGSVTQQFTLKVTAPAVTAVGAEGTDGQLWVQAPQLASGWQPLGGVITGPPAVAAPPNATGASLASPLFIATGTDKHLYVRSLTAGWQQLDAATASCVGSPAAVITGASPSGPFTLTVACRGTDNALWENSATLPATGLPALAAAGWTSLGGVLSAAPAAAPVGTMMTFFVRGTNGAIFTATAAVGYSATQWSCIASPVAAQQAGDGVTTFACQGTDHALWYATDSGSGWTPASSLGGTLIGGPAIAATSQETDFFAEATNGAVFERTAAGWSSVGGTAVGGVGAAALN